MAEGNSVINLGDLAKPATVLIEKVSNAVGVLYEPRRIKNQAQAEVEAEKIKALASIELTDIQQRGMERLIHQETRKQENIENITAIAISTLPDNAKTEELDEDWVAHFFDRCENVSDEKMQTLWSSLLSGEAANPGSYSKRTVDLIASMDKKDADLFTKFCQFVWNVGGLTPLIFDTSNEIYNKQGITFPSLKHLDSIGLISFESNTGFRKMGIVEQMPIFYFGQLTMTSFDKDKDNEIRTGKALLTQAGEQLANICGAVRNQEFYEYAIEQVFKQNITLYSHIPNK